MNFTYFELLVLRFIKLWIQGKLYGYHEPTAMKLYKEVSGAISPKVEMVEEESQ